MSGYFTLPEGRLNGLFIQESLKHLKGTSNVRLHNK